MSARTLVPRGLDSDYFVFEREVLRFSNLDSKRYLDSLLEDGVPAGDLLTEGMVLDLIGSCIE